MICLNENIHFEGELVSTHDEKILTFELVKTGDALDIHMDRQGLAELIQVCKHLYERGGHEHLMTASWGGNELTEQPQSESSKLLNKVTLHLWAENG